jgi:large subunit ribosomal protein L28e
LTFDSQQAVGVAPNEKGGVKVISKKSGSAQKPGSSSHETTFHGGKSSRK